MLKEDEQILLRFQIAKTKLDGLKIFNLDNPEPKYIDGEIVTDDWVFDIQREYQQARERLKNVKAAEIGDLAKVVHQPIVLPEEDDWSEENLAKARLRMADAEKAEHAIYLASLKITDLRPESMRQIQ